MSDMGYCRFQNTLADLRDCNDHILDEGLSSEEERARELLITECQDIVRQFGDETAQFEAD